MNKVTIKDIENVSFDILKQSKSLGVFPTPVDNIVQYCELKVDRENCLSKIPKNYLAKASETLKSALSEYSGNHLTHLRKGFRELPDPGILEMT